ncbi:MAG TPA: hypothetical protein VF485_02730 [Sphingomonas sp.]
MDEETQEKRVRGKGTGSLFFALGQDINERLWTAPTSNRMNFVACFLVLLAGTGSDHRLTKWSAKACEEHIGIGKPRAKLAIEELIACGLVKRTADSSRMMPQYELPELPREAEPTFLPVALVTGLSGEASMLRRVRETGDVLTLRMLVDLYGLVDTDATFGVPLSNLLGGRAEGNDTTAKKIATVGVHAVWAITEGTWRWANGDWMVRHKAKGPKPYDEFWRRVDTLTQLGALWWEPWLFDCEDDGAEPIMPLDPAGYYSLSEPDDEARLTRLTFDVASAIVGDDRTYLFDKYEARYFIPLNLHRQAPAYRTVARLRVEADTPGRRRAWAKRRRLVEDHLRGFTDLKADVDAGHLNKPMRLRSAEVGGM